MTGELGLSYYQKNRDWFFQEQGAVENVWAQNEERETAEEICTASAIDHHRQNSRF
jgi:hypothetical protein